MPRIAFYAGSFDPVTNGHLDVVRQAVSLCDRLIVAIGINPGKKPLFSVDERLAMIQDVFGPLAAKAGCTLEAITYDNLTVAEAEKRGATLMIRGLRRNRPRLRDADRRDERGHGARRAHRLCSRLRRSSPDHRHTGAPD